MIRSKNGMEWKGKERKEKSDGDQKKVKKKQV